jgi:hypothetical protein
MTMDIALTVVGLLLVALAVRDIWASVLHPDAEGVFAKGIRRGTWRLATASGARLPRWRRHLLALAGPAIIALTFIAWILLVILGLTLVVYPMRDQYVAVPDTGELTFLDTLYYVGGTVTVLGYGDIFPVSGTGQMLALVSSALGFTMFTGMASYLIEVVTGMTTRNRFALAIHDGVRGSSGAVMLADCLAEDGAGAARNRCQEWAGHLRSVDELVHRYPLVAFTYRSRRHEYDPEPALRHAAEATVAALVAARSTPGLRGAARELASALTRLQTTIAENYLSSDLARRLSGTAPDDRDRQSVARVGLLVAERAGDLSGEQPEVDEHAANVVHRSRILLDGLKQWTRGDIDDHEWDV